MNLLTRFKQYIHQNNLFNKRDELLLAVSGGVDSVVLCELCKQAGFDFSIAHCNFQLRGEESERDEKFVRKLGTNYRVEVMVKRFDTEDYAAKNKIGIQEAARKLRYEWFVEMLQENPKSEIRAPRLADAVGQAKFVLTAHHEDDNIETVLMNFCRGTGLNGLKGIPNKAGQIRRPLLGFWKHELIEFAKDNNLKFVEDSSNESSKYARNLFRNEILPLISKVYPQVKSNLSDNIDRFKAVSHLYQTLVADLKKTLCKKKNNEIHIPVKQLMGYNKGALIFEIISDFGFTEKQVAEVVKLAESESGKFIQSPNADYRIIKFRNWLVISPGKSTAAETIVIQEGMKSVPCSTFHIQFSLVSDCRLPTADSVACIDANKIKFPIILRRWKQGDYFYPLGMKKKKKLARFFIDQKLSKTDREKIWVLEMNKKIIWVLGLRIDDRFKVTEKTRAILKITLETR